MMLYALGKIKIGGEEYAINDDFVNDCLKAADELDLDELEAARLLVDCAAEGDPETQCRPLWECAVIRFHQERKYLLDCMRLCLEATADDELDPNIQEFLGAVAEEKVFGIPPPGSQPQGSDKKIVPRCMEAMQNVRSTLQSMMEKAHARLMLQQASLVKPPENYETYEFSRLSLVEQHECLAAILHAAVEKHHASVNDFKDLLNLFKKIDKYDHFLGMVDISCLFVWSCLNAHLPSSSVSGSCCLHHRIRLARGSWRPSASTPIEYNRL
jgi:nuclear pore complex protein Nup205